MFLLAALFNANCAWREGAGCRGHAKTLSTRGHRVHPLHAGLIGTECRMFTSEEQAPSYGRVERQCKGSSSGRGTLSPRHCSGTFGSGFEKLLNSQSIQLTTAEENCKPMANASPFKGLQ